MQNLNKIIVIAGPTASGKSSVANMLAYKIDGEVISADSMQVYKNMDIGTNKISKSKQKVNHWGLDIISPNEKYSVADFQKYARECIDNIQSRGKTAIVCGGSGFYIRAVIDGYDYSDKDEDSDSCIRSYYTDFLKNHSNFELWQELQKVDKKSASIIHQNNTVRIIRALELHNSGKCYADLANNIKNIPQIYPAYFFALNMDREKLYAKINDRVDDMINEGLLDEVENLVRRGYRKALTSSQAIGYKELLMYLDNKISHDEAINNIKQTTRRYAKRQLSWFKADNRYCWIDCNGLKTSDIVDFIIAKIQQDE